MVRIGATLMMLAVLCLIAFPENNLAQNEQPALSLPGEPEMGILDKDNLPSNPSVAWRYTNSLSFTDITLQAGTSGPLGEGKTGGHAVAFCDANNDGLPDLYITMRFIDPVTDLFFINNDGSTFSNEASLRGVADIDGGSHGVCFADLDNDGDYDLINGTSDPCAFATAQNNIYLNDGRGYFADVTNTSGIPNRSWPTRAVLAFDMDNDGDLDIFGVTNYSGSEDPPGETNELYRNNGNMSFTAIDSGALFFAPVGQGATDTDYDNDGDVDIIGANRTGPVNILQNDGTGNFTLIEPAAIGITHLGREGITMGDVNNDGFLDLVMVGDGDGYYGHLYINNGDGSFAFRFSFAQLDSYMGDFADLDNDGDLDLVFAGGTVCYINDGEGNFAAGPAIPAVGVNDPRAIGFADIDNDGDLDFAYGCKRSQNFLIRNNLNSGNWLKVKLLSRLGQAGAFGAKVYLYPAGQSQNKLLGMREARSNNGYLGQDDPVLHFGLGENQTVDIVVKFLDGIVVSRNHVAANQTILVEPLDSDFVVGTPEIPAGPINGYLGQNLIFSVKNVDVANCSAIEYQFDWADGFLSDWGGNIQNHMFSTNGTYQIKARARARGQAYGNMIYSDWSESLAISVQGLILTVSTEPADGGSVFKVPEKYEYIFLDTVKLTAVGNNDYEFANWSGDTISYQPELFIIMDHHKNLSAHFSPILETIQAPTIIVTADSAIIGQKSYFKATGAISNLGHRLEFQFDWGDSTFSAWGDSGREKIFNISDRVFVKARARCQVHPEVESAWSEPAQIIAYGLKLFIVLVPAGAGKVSIVPDKAEYAYLDTVKLSAASSLGYKFDYWSGDLQGNYLPGILIMDGSKRVTANYLKIAETLTLPNKPNGPVKGFRNQELKYYARGAVSNLHHEIKYQFDWGDRNQSRWIDSTAIHCYHKNGSYSMRARARCTADTTIISDWSDSLIVNITGCHLAVIINPEKAGNVLLNPNYSDYNYNESVAIQSVANKGYQFLNWDGNVNDTSCSKTVFMTEDVEITANYSFLSTYEEKKTTNVPLEFALKQNVPNPFNAETAIEYQLAKDCSIKMLIYNLKGQVTNTLLAETKPAGYYVLKWNAIDNNGLSLPSGIYICRMEAELLLQN